MGTVRVDPVDVNLAQLHAETASLAASRSVPLPDGWGLVLSGGKVSDWPPTVADSLLADAVAAHTPDQDFGRDADELYVRRQALAEFDKAIVDLQSASNMPQMRAALGPVLEGLRRLVRVVARDYER